MTVGNYARMSSWDNGARDEASFPERDWLWPPLWLWLWRGIDIAG